MAMLGIKLGKMVIMVVEKLEELPANHFHFQIGLALNRSLASARGFEQGRGALGRQRR